MTDTTDKAGRSSPGAREGGEPQSLEAVLDVLADAGSRGGVSFNDILETVSDRSLGVLLTLFGLIAALPIVGAIPGVSIITGVLIMLAVIRSVVGGGSFALPSFVGDREIDEDRLQNAIEKMRPYVARVDRLLKRRLTFVTEGRSARIALSLAAAFLALAMFPLAVVPWGVQAPATGVMAIGLALIARDGVFALVGYALTALTIWIGLAVL